jgi:hypothetical protein
MHAMSKGVSIDELWNSSSARSPDLASDRFRGLPEAAQRYLQHAIATGSKPASAVRLRMHGTIRLRGWFPFVAEEVIRWDRGFIWAASVKAGPFSIRGSDRFLDGGGAMCWKVLGIVPVMSATGPQITRSAIGRLQAESIWLPPVLCSEEVVWTAQDDYHPRAHLSVHGEAADVDLSVDLQGRLIAVKLSRWGNPEGRAYRYVDFGVLVEEEKAFDGYTIPARIRAGWYLGTDRFAPEGEFFRATIDDARYR